jgi:hypothetical protein
VISRDPVHFQHTNTSTQSRTTQQHNRPTKSSHQHINASHQRLYAQHITVIKTSTHVVKLVGTTSNINTSYQHNYKLTHQHSHQHSHQHIHQYDVMTMLVCLRWRVCGDVPRCWRVDVSMIVLMIVLMYWWLCWACWWLFGILVYWCVDDWADVSMGRCVDTLIDLNQISPPRRQFPTKIARSRLEKVTEPLRRHLTVIKLLHRFVKLFVENQHSLGAIVIRWINFAWHQQRHSYSQQQFVVCLVSSISSWQQLAK